MPSFVLQVLFDLLHRSPRGRPLRSFVVLNYCACQLIWCSIRKRPPRQGHLHYSKYARFVLPGIQFICVGCLVILYQLILGCLQNGSVAGDAEYLLRLWRPSACMLLFNLDYLERSVEDNCAIMVCCLSLPSYRVFILVSLNV